MTDFDSAEFVEQLAGRFRDCQRLHDSIERLAASTDRRLDAMKRNTFVGLADVGERLLLVSEERPRGFDEWFRRHSATLGFSTSTSDRCKAAARSVRELGFDEALRRQLEPRGTTALDPVPLAILPSAGRSRPHSRRGDRQLDRTLEAGRGDLSTTRGARRRRARRLAPALVLTGFARLTAAGCQ